MIFEKMKPFLNDFIQYYYDDLQNTTGGYLHNVLDDGNLSEKEIWYCQYQCEFYKDTFGHFIATLMRHFTEDELENLYKDHWGMEHG